MKIVWLWSRLLQRHIPDLDEAIRSMGLDLGQQMAEKLDREMDG